jgi:hypothetical protein
MHDDDGEGIGPSSFFDDDGAIDDRVNREDRLLIFFSTPLLLSPSRPAAAASACCISARIRRAWATRRRTAQVITTAAWFRFVLWDSHFFVVEKKKTLQFCIGILPFLYLLKKNVITGTGGTCRGSTLSSTRSE